MDITITAGEFMQVYRPMPNPIRACAGFPHKYGHRQTRWLFQLHDPHQLWSLVRDRQGLYIVNGVKADAIEILITMNPW